MSTSVQHESAPKKRGQKPITLPERIAVIAWATAVQQLAKRLVNKPGDIRYPANPSAYEVERLLHEGTDRWGRDDDGVHRPKLFDAYINGTHWPRPRTRVVYRRLFPEADYLLDLDLWSLLDEEPPSAARLFELKRMARPSIRERLLERVAPLDPQNPSLRVVRSPIEDVARAVRSEGDLEALTILFVLLREVERDRNVDGHIAVAKYAVQLLFALSVSQPWMWCVSNIFRHARKTVFSRVGETVKVLQLESMDPDREASQRLDLLFAADSAGFDTESPQVAIEQMLLLDQLGQDHYFEYLKKTTTTGRVVIGGHGIWTGSMVD